jgi:hypothetical protein
VNPNNLQKKHKKTPQDEQINPKIKLEQYMTRKHIIQGEIIGTYFVLFVCRRKEKLGKPPRKLRNTCICRFGFVK